MKREEIGGEVPQIKGKVAILMSSMVFTLSDHPPCCSNCSTSDLMSWSWEVLRSVNETIYHCNTLIQHSFESLGIKHRNQSSPDL